MQIHELTAKRHLDEGLLDTIKGSASKAVDKGLSAFTGTTKGFGTGAIPQTGGVAADPSAQPFTGKTVAQMKTKTAQPNPAAIKKFNDAVINAWNTQSEQLAQKKGRLLTDTEYRQELDKFIDSVFFKNRMELLGVAEKQTVQHGIDSITKVRNNPDAVAQEFAQLIQPMTKFTPDTRQALQSWQGKVLDVNLNQDGVIRPAKFSWDGQNWIDAISGRRATGELSEKLTRVALGTVR